MEIEYLAITTKKIAKGIYEATCSVTKPFKTEVSMRGVSEAIAEQKLKLFLTNKPYKHLDGL